MKSKTTVITIGLLLLFGMLCGQAPVKINLTAACLFDGCGEGSEVYGFQPSRKMDTIVSRILDEMGLKSNFILRSGYVQNASATILQDGSKVIVYNEDFIENIDGKLNSNWASIFIIAHEIGHHMNGHNILNLSNNPEDELSADEFAGRVLYRLGASLVETNVVFATMRPGKSCGNHPPREVRMNASKIGWNAAKEKYGPQVSTEPCQINKTGTVCIKNDTEASLSVKWEGKKMYIQPGESDCIYDVKEGTFSFYALNAGPGWYSPGGSDYQVVVKSCQIVNKVIN